MNRKPPRLLALTLAAALGAAGLQAQDERSAEDVRPSYSRNRVERSQVPEPEDQTLPESLRIAVPRDKVDPPAEATEHDDLYARAGQAAEWAADETIERYGRRRYFEVGFHQGLQDAFRRAQRDSWEFEQGRRAARFDPEALGLGEEIGLDEVRVASTEAARGLVIEQFGDLTRQPVRLPAPPPPPFRATGFAVAEPELRDVFTDLSWHGYRGSGYRDMRLDPWRLYQAGGHGAFYKRDWRSARFGFDLWRKRHNNSRWLRGLEADERRLFEQWFHTAFETEVARRFARVADHAFDRGYDSGWRHGTRVGREWQYRRGYHLGFETAVLETAREAFAGSYRAAWTAAYEDLFDEWSTTVKLESRSASLRDGNDDGIFEPGEELYFHLELINVGGVSGRLDARLEGALLTDADRRLVDLPRRSAVRQFEPLRGVILPHGAAETDTLVTVSIGDFTETLPLRVSYVLRFAPGLQLTAHDVLEGTAVVDVRLSNDSRRPVLASLEAELSHGTLRRPDRHLPEIAAGTSRQVRFEIHDIHPLDLIAGDLVLFVAAETGGRPQDRLEARLPELATDLDDHSLVDYLLWLGRSPTNDRAEVRRAHELMLRRLEVDWQAAVRASGNPYKRDLRDSGGSTALGELVAAARAAGGGILDRAVFTDLVPRIDELSRSLPGTHPLLRRSMRKLSRQLL